MSAVMSYLSIRAYRRYLSKQMLVISLVFILFAIQGFVIGLGDILGVSVDLLLGVGLLLEFLGLLGIYAGTAGR